MAELSKPLIQIQNLTVDYMQQGMWNTVVENLNLYINHAETFGLVGESGCGKSTTANTLLGYRPPGSRYRDSAVIFQGDDLLSIPRAKLRHLRGSKIGYVPQNPTTALSPGMRVGRQVTEAIMVHRAARSQAEARQKTLDLFSQVCLPAPEITYRKYPHQLSGGQQQRIVIAMALACSPQLLVLDEPTTGLDVTTQAQIMDLLVDLRAQYGMAMFYVTHNLGVVAQICTRIGVMYAGQLVEVAPVREIFHEPKHPYTQGLIASVPRVSAQSHEQKLLLRGLLRHDELPLGCPFAPRCDFAVERCYREPQILEDVGAEHRIACWRWKDIPAFDVRLAASEHEIALKEGSIDRSNSSEIVEIDDLEAGYSREHKLLFLKGDPIPVVRDISFRIHPGETFGLVGESGSGKTTIAHAMNGFLPYVQGGMTYSGDLDLTIPVGKRSGDLLRSVQLIFQNPDASLNPRQRVHQIIGRPLEIFFNMRGKELRARVDKLLEDVRLGPVYYNRFPDELSGGERQRIAIARALAAEPKLLLCDEILSALDVSVQANILELLVDLQAQRQLAYLFISHNLAVVRSVAHRVGVMYWGTLCEVGKVDEVFAPPYHPYTYLLLSAVPEADPDQVMQPARKDIGLITDRPTTACRFAPRCPWKVGKVCDEVEPPWQTLSTTHQLACHLSLNELAELES